MLFNSLEFLLVFLPIILIFFSLISNQFRVPVLLISSLIFYGVPLLLNTSFNVEGEPIVCRPHDAIKTFFSSGLDILYLQNFKIEKK